MQQTIMRAGPFQIDSALNPKGHYDLLVLTATRESETPQTADALAWKLVSSRNKAPELPLEGEQLGKALMSYFLQTSVVSRPLPIAPVAAKPNGLHHGFS